MKKRRFALLILIVAGLIGLCCLIATSGMADDHHRGKGRHDHEDSHGSLFRKGTDKGNETAGQITAWLLAAANLTVAISLLIKGINRFTPLTPALKNSLGNFNRYQKKHLMPVHYFMNPVILGIAFWHWSTSCCGSTALPEWGLLLMTVLMAFGILLKFRLCPQSLRKGIYRIHTQPVVFISMIAVLTIGHAIID